MMRGAPEPWTLQARWVFPGDAAPLPGGLVTILGDRIAAVEPDGTQTPDADLGSAAILPGFVNAHAHLDLSDARGQFPPSPDFVAWLREVPRHRLQQTPEQIEAAIRSGLAEAQRFGTTLLGDISSGGRSWPILAAASMRAVVFHELLGLTPERAFQACREAFDWFGDHSETSTTCSSGLSPHAPYSFREEMLPLVSANQRLAIHLAESAAEAELLERHSGPFVPFLIERGVWEPSGLARSFAQILESTSAAANALYIHGNYLSPEARIPPHGTIVYCPRTHAAFGHPPHPFRDFLKRGVRVALGTDSLASNPDLDILAEARFIAATYPDLPGATLLRMLTLSGAEALGRADVTGSLTPGKSADLVVLPLPDRDDSDPHRLVFESSLPVQQVMFRGHPLWSAAV
jgi:aminodeoxyfutalosine deaminase